MVQVWDWYVLYNHTSHKWTEPDWRFGRMGSENVPNNNETNTCFLTRDESGLKPLVSKDERI